MRVDRARRARRRTARRRRLRRTRTGCRRTSRAVRRPPLGRPAARGPQVAPWQLSLNRYTPWSAGMACLGTRSRRSRAHPVVVARTRRSGRPRRWARWPLSNGVRPLPGVPTEVGADAGPVGRRAGSRSPRTGPGRRRRSTGRRCRGRTRTATGCAGRTRTPRGRPPPFANGLPSGIAVRVAALGVDPQQARRGGRRGSGRCPPDRRRHRRRPWRSRGSRPARSGCRRRCGSAAKSSTSKMTRRDFVSTFVVVHAELVDVLRVAVASRCTRRTSAGRRART